MSLDARQALFRLMAQMMAQMMSSVLEELQVVLVAQSQVLYRELSRNLA